MCVIIKLKYMCRLYIALSIIFFLSACTQKTTDTNKEKKAQASSFNAIDEYIQLYQERYSIPGISCAIIKDGEVVFQKNYGYANVEHKVSVTDSSLFRLYSLTKPIISVGLFSLIENGRIGLEDKVSDYLIDVPDEWGKVQIKHLLSFSSGLPDMANPYNEIKDLEEEAITKRTFLLPVNFKAGERFEYSQTNFWILQKIIEKVSGMSISDFIIQKQFSKNTESVIFSSDARDIIENRVTSYFPFAKGTMTIEHPYYLGDYSYSMNGLNLSLNDFIVWDKKFNNEQLIKKETIDTMWASFPFSNSEDFFAYGWGKYSSSNYTSYGFTGTGCTMYRNFPERNMSVIFLANGFSVWHNMDYLANNLAHKVDSQIVDIDALFSENLLSSLFKGGFPSFKEAYSKMIIDKKYKEIDIESHLNNIGFILLDTEKTLEAINVFTFYSQNFSNSWRGYNYLGLAFEQNNEVDKALINYKKALNLNTENENEYNTILKEQIERLNN